MAAVYELAPYMNSTSAIGSAGSDAAALASGFTTAAGLVSTRDRLKSWNWHSGRSHNAYS